MTLDLTNKTVLITGATSGLGKCVAGRLAARGATLILHGRNPEKGELVLNEIRSSWRDANLFYYNADFASLHEVNELAETISRHHQQVHLFINNAGVGGGPKGPRKRLLSNDGYELRFAVNYLAHFLLTQKLLPVVLSAAPARIVFVSSIGQAPLDFNDLMMEKEFDAFEAYCRSKLAQIMYAMELAAQLKNKEVVVNSLHPASLMNTQMVQQWFGYTSSTVDEGADVVDYVATALGTGSITGTYFNQKKPGKANRQAYDTEARSKLWEASIRLIKEKGIEV